MLTITPSARAWFALAILGVVMGLLLFVPAGTVDYWQGWVYLSIFMSASALITLDLMRRDPALLEPTPAEHAGSPGPVTHLAPTTQLERLFPHRLPAGTMP